VQEALHGIAAQRHDLGVVHGVRADEAELRAQLLGLLQDDRPLGEVGGQEDDVRLFGDQLGELRREILVARLVLQLGDDLAPQRLERALEEAAQADAVVVGDVGKGGRLLESQLPGGIGRRAGALLLGPFFLEA